MTPIDTLIATGRREGTLPVVDPDVPETIDLLMPDAEAEADARELEDGAKFDEGFYGHG